jgi:Raf kinase inhibitor-like YbhB/YbcL family protein
MTCPIMLKFAPALALVALASCGASNHATNQATEGRTVENATLTTFRLASDAFEEGQPIPRQYTCDGTDHSPALSWGEPPQGTRSFALVVDDPDAPNGTFRHWGVFDIPPNARSLAAGQKAGTAVMNDMNQPGYAGPCPPPGHGVHHYHFKLFALNVERLGLGGSAKVADLENAAKQHAVATGALIGTYERK